MAANIKRAIRKTLMEIIEGKKTSTPATPAERLEAWSLPWKDLASAQKGKPGRPLTIFSQKTNNAAPTATPNKTGDRRDNQITVTVNPVKKAQNFNGYTTFHALTKVLTVPASTDACIESEI